jgi:hypothetical protein
MTSRGLVVVALALVLAAGCAAPSPQLEPTPPPRECAPCGALKLAIEYQTDRFVHGEPPPNTQWECLSLDAALRDYVRCACPPEDLDNEYAGIDGHAFGQWLLHCRDVLNGPPPPLPLRE